MNARQIASLTSATNNAREAVRGLQNGQQQMVAGANNLANGRVAAANRNSVNATNQFGNAHRKANNVAQKLNALANQAPGKLNANIRTAANAARKAAVEAGKANTAKALVHLVNVAQALGKVANTPM